MADFQAPVEPTTEAPVAQPQPEAEQGVVDESVATTGPLAPIQEAPQMIVTNVTKWSPKKNPNIVRYYLQLSNVPEVPEADFLVSLGFKKKVYKGVPSWSKEVAHSNLPTIEGELASIEQTLNVPVGREAVAQMQEFFGMAEGTNEDIITIKQTEEGQQQEVAEELIKNKLEEMAENLDSEETKAFMEQYLAVKKATSGKVHNYSFLNNMLIAWQNFDINEETGEAERRSGFIAPASVWKKEFGREVNAGEDGMEIFVPKGGKRTMKGGGQAALLKALGQFSAMNGGNVDLTNDDNVRKMFGYLRSLVSKKQMYESNYMYLNSKFNKNREQFKSIKDIQDYLGNMLTNKKEEPYYTSTTFMIKPVIFDIDQTTVIPGQEDKDPKPKMDAIRNMWLGMQNEPDKLIDTLFDALAMSARNGLLIPGKNISITTKNTGSAGGYSSNGAIALDQNSAGERQFRTLVHEAAHEILHWGDNRSQLSKEDKEIDADATAYIVLNHYGVGTGAESLNYISMITKDKKVVMARLKPILHASNTIIAAIERQKSMEYDQSQNRQACQSWYKRFKTAHYSEPEQKGEGRGGSGTGQFGERRLGDWDEEHREEVKIMANIIKRQDWTNLEIYKQKLMNKYEAPYNKSIVDGIVSAAMRGQKF